MEIDFTKISEYERYKLMASLIVPRPIALVTTLGADGTINAAPFSMFNMVGEEPPLVMISVNRDETGQLKDTARNILENGEFVVHMVDEEIAERMHKCGERLPPDMSELTHVGLSSVHSRSVRPPRIVETPVAFECRIWEKLETASRHVFIGQILWLHARENLIDTEKWRVRLQNYFPVGRFGASFYTTTRERFAIKDGGGDGNAQCTTIIDEI